MQRLYDELLERQRRYKNLWHDDDGNTVRIRAYMHGSKRSGGGKRRKWHLQSSVRWPGWRDMRCGILRQWRILHDTDGAKRSDRQLLLLRRFISVLQQFFSSVIDGIFLGRIVEREFRLEFELDWRRPPTVLQRLHRQCGSRKRR